MALKTLAAWLVIGCIGTGFASERADSRLPEVFSQKDLIWEIALGTNQYTVPKLDGGMLFVGINDRHLDHPAVERTGGGIFMSLDPATGQKHWQLPIPRYMEGIRPPFHFNHWACGVISQPVIEGDRLYIVSPRGEVLCLDRMGQANGNTGPFVDEAAYMGAAPGYELTKTDGDIIWLVDMIEQFGVVPHDACGSNPLLLGDYLYVNTSNGVDNRHDAPANPDAPSLIVLDKHTGALAATDGGRISPNVLHGQWSSPVAAEFDGQKMVLFGGGDGVLYAFEPLAGSGTGQTPESLNLIWKYDCNPAEYRMRDGNEIPYSRHNRRSPDGPSEIIATPTVVGNRVYIAIGQSPNHGPGQGCLTCLDGKTGKKIWENRQVERSLATAAVQDGLLYIPDFTGRMHCLDANTGEILWQQDLESGVWSASPLIVEDKVYISTERRELWVFKAGREKEVLGRCRVDSPGITPLYENGVLYLPTQHRLFAIRVPEKLTAANTP